MALRATNKWRSMLVRLGGNRQYATSAAPKAKQFAQSPSDSPVREAGKFLAKAENAPIAVVLGMVMVALAFGTHTAKQQLVHSPSVILSKKKRESLYEVDDPDDAISSADKFINKSLLRKVAHIQDPGTPIIPDPVHPDPFTRSRNATTLKTAGVDPRRR